MKNKTFCVLLAVMLALFAALSIGGCGSSSSLTQDSGGENETGITDSDSLDMTNALDSDDVMNAIGERLMDNPLILLGLAEARIYDLEISGDGQIWATDISFYDDEEEEVPETADVPMLYDKDEFWRHYESGDIIILEEADIDFINTIRADIGQNSEDASITGEAGSLEVYALAKRSILEGQVNIYSYAVPRMDRTTAPSTGEGEPLKEEDSTENYDGNEEITEPVNSTPATTYSNVDFVVDKWVDFFSWMAAVSLFTKPAEYVVNAAEVQNLADISDTQKQIFDFSYNDLDADGIIFSGKDSSAMKFKRARMNKLEFDISSAHSFKDKKDYYFVRAKASTTPKNFNDTVVMPWGADSYKFNYVYGYTNSLRFAAELDDAPQTAKESTALSLAAEIPSAEILADGSDTTESLTYTVEGPVGVLKYLAERIAQDGIVYSDSNTWNPEGYILVNQSGGGSVGFDADVKRPVRGSVIRSSNEPPSWYYEAVANEASKNPLEYTASWVWVVSDDFWRVHPTMKMNVELEVIDGATSGQSYYNSKTYSQAGTSFGNTNNASFVLTQPPHTVIQADNVPFTTTGSIYLILTNFMLKLIDEATNSHIVIRDEAGTETIRIFAEDDWTITAREVGGAGDNWLKVSPESGSATGPEGTEVRLEYTANPLADKNQARLAMVEVHSGNDNVKLCVSQANQFYEKYSPNIQ